MISRKFALGAAVVACAAGAAVAPSAAGAEELPPPSATATVSQVRPVVVANAGSASVQFHYSCVGTVETDHLYIAVKEGPTISPENTSSSGATGYYSTNWSVDSGPNALTCDGRKHLMQAVLTPDTVQGPAKPALKSGSALLQICLFDSGGLTLDYSMKRVVVF
ncbi:MAG: hypothetical protein ACTHMS_00530 [Jatrophihabitans sp.]|uniref:hypothetical protein n=1 Tax=Jatrophihabitans sp. TaxID=1932789 RepID=UPI003F7D2C6E